MQLDPRNRVRVPSEKSCNEEFSNHFFSLTRVFGATFQLVRVQFTVFVDIGIVFASCFIKNVGSGCYESMGDMEACLHDCPDESVNGDVNNCEVWIKRMKHE